MQSTSASDGSYTLTVTFKIGTDLDTAQVLVQNRVASALASLPTAVQSQGVKVREKGNGDPVVRDFDVARQPLRQSLSRQLRDDQHPGRAVAATGRRRRQCFRCRPIFDARVARPGKAQSAKSQRPGYRRNAAAAEPAGHRRPGRRSADAAGRELPIHDRRPRPPQRRRGVRQCDRENRQQRRDHAPARRRPRRTRRADLQPDFHPRRSAVGRYRHLSDARCERARRRRRGQGQDGRAGAAISARAGLFDPVRHHRLRRPVDP